MSAEHSDIPLATQLPKGLIYQHKKQAKDTKQDRIRLFLRHALMIAKIALS